MSYARSFPAAPIAAALLLLGGAAFGCTLGAELPAPVPPPVADAGTDASASARALAVVPDAAPRTVLFGESLAFAVRYTEADGRPVSGAEVAFAMVGVAHDATLAETSARTGADGVARGTLRAGRTRAAFRVRASASRAAAAGFDVAIGDAGFGALRAEVRYAGARALATRTVSLYADVTCAEADAGATPDREQPLVEFDDTVRFVALPAGPAYAVVARGEGADGALLARGCVDGAVVANGAEVATLVTLDDVPARVEGVYDATLDLRTPSATLAVGETTARVLAAAAGSGGDTGSLLDAVALDLADRDPAAAAAFATQRLSEGLDTSLSAALDAAGASPSRALVGLAADAAEAIGALRVTGTLTLDARGRAEPDGLVDLGIAAAPERAGGPLDLRLDMPTNAVILSGYAPVRGLLVVEDLSLRLPLGATIAATLEAVSRERGERTAEALVARDAGCDAVARWAAAQPAMAAGCGESCARAACVGVSRALVAQLAAALADLDASRAAIGLGGAVPATDGDRDVQIDALGPERLMGRWATPGRAGGDEVSATLAARRR